MYLIKLFFNILLIVLLGFSECDSIGSENKNYSEYLNSLHQLLSPHMPRNEQLIYLDTLLISSFDNPELKLKALSKIIQNQTGQVLNISSLKEILGLTEFNTSFATKINSIHVDGKLLRLCVVVPSNPNLKVNDFVSRMFNLEFIPNKMSLNNIRTTSNLSNETWRLLTDLHEGFHCLDKQYFNANHLDNETMHEAEAFADVSALLLIGNSREPNLAKLRGEYRAVEGFLAGRYLRQFTQTLNFDYGYIYSFYNVLFEAQNKINKLDKVLTVDEVIELGVDLVENYKLNEYEAHAVIQYQRSPEDLNKTISLLLKDDNPRIANRFSKIKLAAEEYADVIEKAFKSLISVDSESLYN